MRAGDADRGEYSAGTTVHRPVQPRPSHGPDPGGTAVRPGRAAPGCSVCPVGPAGHLSSVSVKPSKLSAKYSPNYLPK